ncbi:MAG: hypothetical protein ACRDNS_26015 [Trebonia sp.]
MIRFALIATAGVALLATACGSPVNHETQPSSAATAQSAHQDAALTFARCMRAHGVPSFPDPDSQGDFPPFQTGVSKQVSAAANETCKRLLPSGGAGAGTGGDQQKLAFALQVARCMRSHGFPAYPDPTLSSQGGGTRFDGTGIDTKSPEFQTRETSCERQERKALGLP